MQMIQSKIENLGQGEINYIWCSLAIEELVKLGAKYIFLCPGFRNSPLVLAARANKNIKCISVVDERSAAFLALGVGKHNSNFSIVCSTSGTAVANFFPAALEAKYSHAPLLLLSADRPRNLVGLGANQTMDQYELFGKSVKHFMQIESPRKNSFPIQRMLYDIYQTISASRFPQKGPVHLNLSLEEPLLPVNIEQADIILEKIRANIFSIQGEASDLLPSKQQKEKITSSLKQKENIVCILGAGSYDLKFYDELIHFANRFSIPVLAEPSSGFCFGKHTASVNTLITHPELISKISTPIDAILRIGAVPINKELNQFLDKNKSILQIIFDLPMELRNPSLGNTVFINNTHESLFGILSEAIKPNDPKIVSEFKVLEEYLSKEIQNKINQTPFLSERKIWKNLLEAIPENSNLFIGNSMPIRDFNAIAAPTEKNIQIFHNRGLSGIDGLIATSTGIALASKKNTYLVIGDLSVLHDSGSLATVANLAKEINLTIIILNNHGGDIFRTLPTKKFDENWFTTPQIVCFKHLANAFSIPYYKINTSEEFINSWNAHIENISTKIIEVEICAEANFSVRGI